MTRANLAWYRLRFPRDLDLDAVQSALSAFSGLPYHARIILDLSATSAGTTHRLGISRRDTESVLAHLRAAVPSLRTEPLKTPPKRRRGLLVQMAPAVGALRADEPTASSATLISSLFPLRDGEEVCLRWTLRSAPLPPLPVGQYSARDGRERIIRGKLALAGMAAYGELVAVAASTARREQLFQRTASVLWSLATPYGRLAVEPHWLGNLGRLGWRRGRYLNAPELSSVIGWPISGPDLPGLELGAAKRLVPSAELATEGRRLGTSDAPGLTRPVAISESASTKGLWLLGPTGTGKTSLLRNLIRDDLEQGRGLVCLETNGDLINDLVDAVPESRIRDVLLLDPTDPDYAVGFNPFAASADPSLVADQLGELFQRLWAAFWGPRTAQLAHMGLLTLARRQGSTLLDLPRLYLDPAFRAKVLANLDDPVGLGPDWGWFEGLKAAEQINVVSPLLNKARAWTARPAIRAIVGQTEPRLTMRQIIDQKKILLVNLPKGLIGGETAQLLGCLVLTAVWQAATERAALSPSQRHPFGLYVDEWQDLAAAPVPWDEMLAQGRKYGLAVTVANQNLEQIPRELREVVLANARSKAVFALSASDAKIMERLFAPALTAADLQALDAYSIAAQVALDNGSTARPVTLLTPPPPPPLGTTERVRAESRANYAKPRAEIEDGLRRRSEPKRQTSAPVGRRPRSQS